MKTECRKAGFSLIETLVVCVIVAILAAVSIPMYIGYVNGQRQSTVNNLAETAAAAANAYVRRTGNTTPTVDSLRLYYNSNSYTVTIPGDSGNQSVKVVDKNKTTIAASRKF